MYFDLLSYCFRAFQISPFELLHEMMVLVSIFLFCEGEKSIMTVT